MTEEYQPTDADYLVRARNLLDYARAGKELIERAEVDGDEWGVVLTGVLSSLRAVGHVLKKLDGDSAYGIANARLFKEVQRNQADHEIFHAFIKRWRDVLLKEGHPRAFTFGRKDDKPLYIFAAPPYEGRRQAEVIQEAIDWWDQYLQELGRAT